MAMSVRLIVNICVLVLAAYGWCCILLGMRDPFRWAKKTIAERDERALLNRQRKAARDREMRKVESTADRAAQMHEIFADVIHPTTPYCDYLDTPRDAMPRVRRSKP
jgi:hypothetical protein